MDEPLKRLSAYRNLILLMLAGETVFLLPFVLSRIFRPTFLSAFDLNNSELGSCFSVYGIVAIFAYFLGGWFADRFRPGQLMGVALVLTGLGGFYMASFPGYYGMLVLFGYWGLTTILLFWAAMIKATRIWGGERNQGKAFGFLEAGRGLVASSIGLIGAYIFATIIGDKVETAEVFEKKEALRQVILFSAAFALLIGALVFLFLKFDSQGPEKNHQLNPLKSYWSAIQIPAVWLLMLIVLTAYVGYKSTDFIAQYAHDVLNYNDGESAKVGAFFLYLRPTVAVLIGFLADRSRAILWVILGFALTLVGAGLIASGTFKFQVETLFLISTLLLGLGVYATRALYFALLKEGTIPLAVTGIAVSLVSVVGYLPDVFMGPLTGYFLDHYPEKTGFQWVFGILVVFSLIGFVSAYFFAIRVKKWKANV